MELLIVRHARPEAETRPEGEGADPPLSGIGRLQAQATADLLAGEGEESIDHIVTSSMRRAVETAAPLALQLGLDPELLADLEESDRHRSEYVPAEEMDDDHVIVREFLEDRESVFGGDYPAFRRRVTDAFDGIVEQNRGRTVAVYCHGMVMGVFLQSILGYDDPFAILHDYCGILRVTASSNGLRTVRCVNEAAHVRHLLG
ncbi:MAG: histidine phosphatase family protein [Actinobacteria bacterium]|nr:histidine phosphatase family protein [Actinomycetota bacterium]